MKTNKFKLLLSCGAIAVLGAMSLEGCSSSDDTTTSTGGKGGTGTGGTSSGGKGGTAATSGGTSSGGKGGAATGGTASGGTSTGGTGTGGKAAGGTGPGIGGANDVAGAGGDLGAAGAATDVVHPSADECTAFCELEATACTGANLAYASTAVCNTDCAAFTLGDDSDPTRTAARSGDNFACRAYHLHNVIVTALPTTHCPHTANVSLQMDGSKGPCAN